MQDNPISRFIKIVVFSFFGLAAGVTLFYAIDKGWTIQIMGIGIFLVLSGLVAIVFKQRNVIETLEERQKGLVLNTFQDVVGKLKEDEKELEKSKVVAEEKAEHAEAYNENILQSVPSGVISIDNGLSIKSVNQSAERILGISGPELVGKPFCDVFDGPFADLVREEKSVFRAEYQFVTTDKRHVYIGVTTSLLKNASGQKIGLIFVFTDLTDIKKLQEQVELKRRLSQLGEMSAGISHELRNSMSVISGYARLLGKKADASLKPTVESITSEIKNMDMIISELLAFAKPTVPSLEEVELTNLIEEAAGSVDAAGKGVTISLYADNEVKVHADGILLRQAISNLLHNAIDAMPDGGSVDVSIQKLTEHVKISVSDTGSGIPGDIIQKIFLPFYTTKDEGTGFGLALVQKIIISHGGSIDVKSEESQGTTFTILLPV